MKGFFENFLALSVNKRKKVLMILPSISGRGRAFPAESCCYMPCLANSNFYRRWTPKLENLTLADWAAWYDNCSSKPYVKETREIDIDGLPLQNYIDDEQNDDDDEFIKTTSSKTRRHSKARVLRSVWFNKQKEPEKHYRELSMLFTPWRNEETDLLGSFKSYGDRCMVLSNVIEEQMKQYAVCNEDFNEIQQRMNQMEDRYDDIAPCTQNME